MTDYEFACEQVEFIREAIRDAVLAASTSDGRGIHERQDIEKLRKFLSAAMRERDALQEQSALSPSSVRRSGRTEYRATFDQ